MAALSTTMTLVTLMMQFECPVVPHSESDIQEAKSFALEVAPSHLANVDFESVELSKCEKETFDQPSNTTATMEVLRFDGYFPNTSNVSDVSIKEHINCKIVRTIGDSGLSRVQRTCSRMMQQLLTYPGVTSPIEISDGLTIDEARLVLSFFSGHVGKNIEKQQLTQEEVSSIHRMYAFGRPGGMRRFYATTQSGCISKSIWVAGSGSSPISFAETGRSGSIC